MKQLSVVGFIIAVLLFLGSMYLQFVVSPMVSALYSSLEYSTDETSLIASRMWSEAYSFQSSFGIVVLLGGIVSLGMCIFPALKLKSKLAWAGVALSVISVLIGLINGTHMFS